MQAHLAIIAVVTFGAFMMIFGSSALRFTIGCFITLAAVYAAGVLLIVM